MKKAEILRIEETIGGGGLIDLGNIGSLEISMEQRLQLMNEEYREEDGDTIEIEGRYIPSIEGILHEGELLLKDMGYNEEIERILDELWEVLEERYEYPSFPAILEVGLHGKEEDYDWEWWKVISAEFDRYVCDLIKEV